MKFDHLIPQSILDGMPPVIRARWERQMRPNENMVGNLKVDVLHLHLFESAKDFARFALTHFKDETSVTQIQSAVAAGSAIEYLSRCVVLDADPVLLAQTNHLDSQIALSRAPRPKPLNPKLLKTISAAQAITLVKKLHPEFDSVQKAEEVFALRNAAAHMAFAMNDDMSKDMISLVTVVSDLLVAMKEDEDNFWGANLADVVRFMKKEASDEVRNGVHVKIASARERFDRLKVDFQGDAQETMLQLLESKRIIELPDYEDIEVERECPACHRRGQLNLIKRVDTENALPLAHSESPEGMKIYARVTGIPALFACPVCDLRLFGDELDSFNDLRRPIALPKEMVVDLDELFKEDWEGRDTGTDPETR